MADVALVGTGMIPIPPPDYGAVEKHIWNLSQALEDRGHDVTIVHEVVGESSLAEYRFAWQARSRVRDLDADVVHVHTPGVAAVFTLAGPRRYVFTSHSRHWTTREGLRERIGFLLERWASSNAAETVAVSPMVAHRMARRGVEATVVPNGVDLDRYAPDWDARSGDVVVGVGELAPHKGWHLVAKAVADLEATFRHVGPHRSQGYARRVREAAPGQVTLEGRVPEDDLVDALAAGDVLAHPSTSESFGMAVVEGMACGLPVVASDFLSPLFEPGANGVTVPTDAPEDRRVEALRDGLVGLLDDPDRRRAFGERSRAIAEERYGWDGVAGALEDVYEAFQAEP